jgi:hypothetical protein
MYEAAEFNRMNKSNGYLPDLFWIEHVRIGSGLSLYHPCDGPGPPQASIKKRYFEMLYRSSLLRRDIVVQSLFYPRGLLAD